MSRCCFWCVKLGTCQTPGAQREWQRPEVDPTAAGGPRVEKLLWATMRVKPTDRQRLNCLSVLGFLYAAGGRDWPHHHRDLGTHDGRWH
jgi:hypothetical protein